MNVTTLPPGTKGIDTVTKLTRPMCAALRDSGIQFVVRYLPSLTADEIADIGAANLCLSLVTYAKSFDPADELRELAALHIPKGVVVWLDVEGVTDEPGDLKVRINTWARAIKAAGYIPGGYFGSQQLLTSTELYALAVERYWHACSRVVDITGAEAAPSCGWAMYQLFPPNLTIAGVTVDVDYVQRDFKNRGVEMVSV